jgi:hypothetical protein
MSFSTQMNAISHRPTAVLTARFHQVTDRDTEKDLVTTDGQISNRITVPNFKSRNGRFKLYFIKSQIKLQNFDTHVAQCTCTSNTLLMQLSIVKNVHAAQQHRSFKEMPCQCSECTLVASRPSCSKCFKLE